MENKHQRAFHIAVGFITGVFITFLAFSLSPLQNLANASEEPFKAAAPVAQPQRVVFTYKGIVLDVSDSGFSVYDSLGNLTKIATDSRTKFFRNSTSGSPAKVSLADLKANYSVQVSLIANSNPPVADFVISTANMVAPYPYKPQNQATSAFINMSAIQTP